MISALGIEHGEQQLLQRVPPVTGAIERASDAMQLRSHELPVQDRSLRREIKQALTAIKGAFLLNDISSLDQFAQNATQGLLGDLKYVEKLGDAHAGISADEMQDAMMSATKADGAQDRVGISGEIAIGKKQKLDQFNELLVGHQFATGSYVNHVDIFCIVNYRIASVRIYHFRVVKGPCEGGFSMAAVIPFDQREGYIWMNGDFVAWKDAKVHVLTHALHYGSAVFEGERAYGGEIFKLREHTERLFTSAEMLDMKIPYTVAEIDEACRATLRKQSFKDAYVRPIAWRGSEMMGVSAQSSRINVAIAVWEWPAYFDPAQVMKGIRLDMAEWRRPDPRTAPAKAKAVGLYMICTLSKHAAERKGYADALMLDWRGQVAECTGANVFFVKNGELHTPTPDCFLDGITRRTVIALAQQRQIKVIERAIMPEEMAGFEQCFIVGTAAEVTPVSEVGPYRFEVGDITKTLRNDYLAAVLPTKAAA